MTSIGRYKITGELGRGAMGIVYRAWDSKIGRDVAIKTIHLREVADASERQRLRDRLFREAQSAGVLSHPNIVTIYDVAEEGDVAFLAMELVDGPTLDRVMAAEPLTGKFVLSVLSQTAAALDFAHKRGIVHRDIKPANIMINEGATVKITDFGVARLLSHQMTQVGSMVGTPNYMSPEQIQTKPVDGRSDQFSLAVIAYELLTGEKPFIAESIAALAYKIVREPPLAVNRINSSLDWPIDTVLQRALAKEPEQRYPTCSDFIFALENACRACRKWRPLRAGAAQQLATSFEAPAPMIAPGAVDAQAPVVTEGPPFFLRVARLVALLVIGGGLIAAVLVTSLRYIDERQPTTETPAVETPPPPTEAAPSKRPSAMGGLPGDAGSNPPAPTAEEAEPVVEKPKPATPAVAPATGAVRLITNPPGAELVIDGNSELSCKTPCSLTLPKGRHTLAATMPGFRRTLRILQTPQDNEVFLNLDRATGSMLVRSEPNGASIFINGQAKNEKTPAMLSLPVGNYTVEIVYQGQRETHEVQVRDSSVVNVAVQFSR